MKSLISNNYKTYFDGSKGEQERHGRRFVVFCCAALIVAMFGRNSISDAYSVLITSITILTGFTFTALFSDHALADVGLAPPKNENDRHDIIRLGLLGHYFKSRSAYFIALSIITVVGMTVVSIDLVIPEGLRKVSRDILEYADITIKADIIVYAKNFVYYFATLMAAIVVFMYLECLYTFYRLSETILTIVNLRREYIRHAENIAQ